MPKISRHSGPSYALAEPGDTAVDALQRVSALHPEEQNALLLDGTENEDEWLRNKPGHDNQGYKIDDDGNRIDPDYRNSEDRGAEPAVGESDPKDGLNREKDGEGVSLGDNSSQSSEKQPNSDDKTKLPLPKRVRATENRSDETGKTA